jgi:hypothetical protein
MTVVLQDGFLQIFDADHGQCALLTIPGPAGPKRVMIDCGDAVNLNGTGKPWYPSQHLQSMGIKWIDLLIATSYDEEFCFSFRNCGTLVWRGTKPPGPMTAVGQ